MGLEADAVNGSRQTGFRQFLAILNQRGRVRSTIHALHVRSCQLGGELDFLKYGVGWIIAIAALGAGAYYFFYGKRRKRLLIESSASSIILASVRARDQLKVSFNDVPVSDPWVVRFSVLNVGHKDIASKDFDAEKPLVVHANVDIIARLQASDTDDADMIQIGGDNTTIEVRPSKLAVGCHHHIRLLASGEPKFRIGQNPLIDTDVVRGIEERIRMLHTRLRISVLSLFCFVLFFSVFVILFALGKHVGVQRGHWWFMSDMIVGPNWAVVAMWIAGLILLCGIFLDLIDRFGVKKSYQRSKRRSEFDDE